MKDLPFAFSILINPVPVWKQEKQDRLTMNHVPDVTSSFSFSEPCYARIFFFLGLKYFELLII